MTVPAILPNQSGRLLTARGPFSLSRAMEFLRGFAPAGVAPPAEAYAVAHVVNGRPLLVRLDQAANDELRLSVSGPNAEGGDLDAAESLVRRVFSLDLNGDAFYERVGGADPVLADLQQRFAGLRPVLFGSPFEALCWAVIGQRISIPQASRLKAHLAARLGPTVTADCERFQAFPAPEHLLTLDPGVHAADLRLPLVKIERLRGLAERGARGDFEAARLLLMSARDARAWLEQSPGVGPWASEFALIRGAGHPDLLPRGEQRLLRAVQRYYGLPHEPSFAEVERLAEPWAGFRSWAAFLLRVALQADTHEIAAPACGAMAPAEQAVVPR